MIVDKAITLQPWKVIVHNSEEMKSIAPQLAEYGYKVSPWMTNTVEIKPIVLYLNAEFCKGKRVEYNDYPDPPTKRYDIPIYWGRRSNYNTKAKILCIM